MINKVTSALLVLATFILSYPFIDQIGLGRNTYALLVVLILCSIGALIWNFRHHPITRVLVVFLIVDLVIGLRLLYYLLTVQIMY